MYATKGHKGLFTGDLGEKTPRPRFDGMKGRSKERYVEGSKKQLYLGEQKSTRWPTAVRVTPPKFNMEPENQSLEKEIPIGNHHSQVPC